MLVCRTWTAGPVTGNEGGGSAVVHMYEDVAGRL